MYRYEAKNASGHSRIHFADMDVGWYELYIGELYIATFTDDISEEQMQWICDALNFVRSAETLLNSRSNYVD